MIVRTAEHRGPKLGPTVGWSAMVRSVGVRPWWLYVPATEWDRKADVRKTPTSGEIGTTIALLVALAVAGLIGALVRLSRPALQALRRRLRARGRTLPPRMRLVAITLASLASLVGVVAVGGAVAGTAKLDSHVYEYRPIREVAAGIERLIPPGRTIGYRFGPLDLGTQPMETAIRFFLVRHGDRVLAKGSFPRLGSYYELYNRPVQWIVYLLDGTRPQRHMTLAARVRFSGPWGKEALSAWVRKAQRER